MGYLQEDPVDAVSVGALGVRQCLHLQDRLRAAADTLSAADAFIGADGDAGVRETDRAHLAYCGTAAAADALLRENNLYAEPGRDCHGVFISSQRPQTNTAAGAAVAQRQRVLEVADDLHKTLLAQPF